MKNLFSELDILSQYKPAFISVTYGAGGSTQEKTLDLALAIRDRYAIQPLVHFTCVGAGRNDIQRHLDRVRALGLTDILALRGDPPKGAGRFTPHPEGFRDSAELVAALAETGLFRLRVGAYPDRHPEAADDEADIRWLKHKMDAGAHSAITQFFFEPETFLRFRDRAAAAGIAAPILPGILPIENWAGVKRFASRCGAQVPGWLDEAFRNAARDGREELLSVALCTELCDTLISEGVEDLHFYTLNRPHLTREVCHALGITAQPALEKVA